MVETDEVVSLVRDTFAAFDHDDREGFTALLADDAVWLSHATGRSIHHRAEIVAASWSLRTAFPDLKREFTQPLTSGDRAVVEAVWSGTHTGDLVTASHVVPPTGRHVRWHACYVVTAHAGKVSSVSEYYDQTGFFAQLGVLPRSGVAHANEAIMRRFYRDVLETGNTAAVAELVAPGFVDHIPQPIPGQPLTGPEAITSFVGMLRTAIPDIHVTLHEVMADETTVMARVTWTGTHSGTFMRKDPTGKRIKATGFDMARIADGKIVEHWGQIDVLGILGQLDFLPDLVR